MCVSTGVCMFKTRSGGSLWQCVECVCCLVVLCACVHECVCLFVCEAVYECGVYTCGSVTFVYVLCMVMFHACASGCV